MWQSALIQVYKRSEKHVWNPLSVQKKVNHDNTHIYIPPLFGGSNSNRSWRSDKPSWLSDKLISSMRTIDHSTFGTRAFSVPYQQSGIHCLIICAIQLLTPNNLGGTYLFAVHSKRKRIRGIT